MEANTPAASGLPSPPPYPLQPIRHRYVTRLGGMSEDLEPWQVGVRREALEQNTDLVPFEDEVHVLGGDEDPRPLFTRDLFTVVPLDETRPRAQGMSPAGQAVFSTHAFDDHTRDHPMGGAEEGLPIVMNATLSRRWSGDDPDWSDDLVARRLDPGS
jgi:hypothetical protein